MALSAILASIVALAAPPQDPVDLASLVQQMKELRARGAYAELIPVVEDVQDRLRDAGLVEDAIKLHMWRSDSHAALRDFDAALAALADGREAALDSKLSATASRAFTVEFRIAESRLLESMGRVSDSEEAARHATDAAGETRDELTARALSRRAGTLIDTGKPIEAAEAYDRALRIVPPNSIPSAWLRSGQTKAWLQLGQAERALKELDALRSTFDKSTPAQLVLVVDSQRATAAMFSDKFDLATEIWQSMVQLLAGDPRRTIETARARAELAVCLRATGRHTEALDIARSAVESLESLVNNDHPVLASALYGLGNALRDVADSTGDARYATDARTAYERALTIRSTRGMPAACWDRIRLGVLIADYFPDETELALELLSDAIDGLETLRRAARTSDETLRASYFRRIRNTQFARWDPYENRARLQLRNGERDAAFAEIERGRARSALDLVQRGGGDLVARAREAAQRNGAHDLLERLDTAVTNLRQRRADVERATVPRPDDFADLVRAADQAARACNDLAFEALPAARPANISTIRSTLRDGERLLTYVLGPERSMLFLVPPPGERLETFDLLDAKGRAIGESRIAALVDRLRGSIVAGRAGQPIRGDRPSDRPDSKRESPMIATAHELFGILLPGKAWKAVRSAPTVYIVPHRALHLLPFESLVVKPGGNLIKTRFWIDEGPTIAYGPSGSMLAWSAGTRAAQRERARAGDVVVLANPRFEGEDKDLAPLPGTEAEAKAIEASIPDATRCIPLVGAEATEAALTRAAAGARVVHLATHQVPAPDSAWSAGRIVMTRAGESRADDGSLEVDELLDHWLGRLRDCELVVISSCRSRLGMLSGDEGVFGFPWGFQYSGCPSILASLWPVSDRATSKLMADFYPRLLEANGKSRASALTEARRRLRAESPHPFYWAPFIWIGSPY